MKEFQLIEAIRKELPPAGPFCKVGAGDDAAVLEVSPRQVLTTDTQIEGVHFNLKWLSLPAVGARAVEITLSDLAAMGATQKCILLALQLPETMSKRSALSLVRGVAARAEQRNCALAGGNVAIYRGPLALTLTAFGEKPPAQQGCLRSQAEPGQSVYVTGVPGIARLGLEALRKKVQKRGLLKEAVKQFLEPRACLGEIRFLLSNARLGAVIDLSDGVAGDIGHILKESSAGCEITPAFTPEYKAACRKVGLEPEACFLGPSDDYELLFTADRQAIEKVKKRFKKHFGKDLNRIGIIRKEPGLWLVSGKEKRSRITTCSFEHITRR